MIKTLKKEIVDFLATATDYYAGDNLDSRLKDKFYIFQCTNQDEQEYTITVDSVGEPSPINLSFRATIKFNTQENKAIPNSIINVGWESEEENLSVAENYVNFIINILKEVFGLSEVICVCNSIK